MFRLPGIAKLMVILGRMSTAHRNIWGVRGEGVGL